VEDYEPLTASIMGKTVLEDDRYKIEDMALIDMLGQTVGSTYTAPCPKTFGGQEHGGCGVDVTTLDVVGAVTSITSDLVFVDTSRTESADYFGWGTVQFTSGPNAGLAVIKVRDFSGGTFTLYEPPYYPLTIGDTYVAIPGCRKRLEDCRDKYANVLRFGGYPWVPTSSTYRQVGER
jgi:uncharacterized phage protein (TIGR02218 family)